MVRVGFGYDVHRLISGRKLVLGGVVVTEELGAEAHSDGDVLLHAVCDALLGAAALGDIGMHFPDTDPAYKGISSLVLLRRVRMKLESAGFAVGNIDATVILERPKIAPFIGKMRSAIADVLGIQTESLSIKATTGEQLGFVGEGRGVVAHAVAIVHERSHGS